MAEPWCKSIGEIRKLTDWQIHNLIFIPALRAAAKRDKKTRRDRLPRKRRGKKYRMRLPNKDEYFLVGEKLGMPRDRMEREWAQVMEQHGKPE